MRKPLTQLPTTQNEPSREENCSSWSVVPAMAQSRTITMPEIIRNLFFDLRFHHLSSSFVAKLCQVVPSADSNWPKQGRAQLSFRWRCRASPGTGSGGGVKSLASFSVATRWGVPPTLPGGYGWPNHGLKGKKSEKDTIIYIYIYIYIHTFTICSIKTLRGMFVKH